MAETFILIPGRTSRQGTAPSEGKFTAACVEKTSTLQQWIDTAREPGRAIPEPTGRLLYA